MGLIVFELEDQDSDFRYGFWVAAQRAIENPLHEIHVWCAERFGEPGTIWMVDGADVWFAQEVHAMEFKLRWV